MRPQHLQHMQLRLEQLQTLTLQSGNPFFWGIQHLNMDFSQATSGVIRVWEITAIMPDGCYIHYKHDMPNIKTKLELDLTQHNLDGTYDIHLCLPEVDIDVGIANQSDNFPRYLSRNFKTVKDQNTGQNSCDSAFLVPNLQLLPESSVSTKMISMPIAKMTCQAGRFSLEKFIPPSLAINLEHEIGKQCLNLVDILRSKISYMLGRNLSGAIDAISQEYANVTNLLSFGLLEFEALLRSAHANPFQLYLSLTRLAGFIKGVSNSITPPIFDAYDHHDMSKSFTQIIDFIIKVLDYINDGYFVISFNKIEDRFVLNMRPDFEKQKLIIGVRLRANMNSADINSWLNSTLIVSEEILPSVRGRRILGAKRHLIDSHSKLDLVSPKGMILIEVEFDQRFIKKEQNLVIYSPDYDSRKAPTELVLYLPKELKEEVADYESIAV